MARYKYPIGPMNPEPRKPTPEVAHKIRIWWCVFWAALALVVACLVGILFAVLFLYRPEVENLRSGICNATGCDYQDRELYINIVLELDGNRYTASDEFQGALDACNEPLACYYDARDPGGSLSINRGDITTNGVTALSIFAAVASMGLCWMCIGRLYTWALSSPQLERTRIKRVADPV